MDDSEQACSRVSMEMDDTLSQLVSDSMPPCSIDDINPDVECDTEIDDLLLINEPKDIINGYPVVPDEMV